MRIFTAKITSIDAANGVMYLDYSTNGHAPVQVGVRMPLVGEDEAAIIRAAAPHAVWDMAEYKAAPKKTLVEGAVFSFTPPVNLATADTESPAPEIIVRRVAL